MDDTAKDSKKPLYNCVLYQNLEEHLPEHCTFSTLNHIFLISNMLRKARSFLMPIKSFIEYTSEKQNCSKPYRTCLNFKICNIAHSYCVITYHLLNLLCGTNSFIGRKGDYTYIPFNDTCGL